MDESINPGGGTLVTQPNPVDADKSRFKKLIDAAVDDFLVRLFSEGVDSYKKINEWADEPLDENGNGRGFLKPSLRSPGFFAKARTDETEYKDEDFLGFVTEDKFSDLKEKSTELFGGANTDASEAVDTAWANFLGDLRNPTKLKNLQAITESLLENPTGLLPLSDQSSVFPDNGTAVLRAYDFHLASLLLRAYGGWRGFGAPIVSNPADLQLEGVSEATGKGTNVNFGILLSRVGISADGEYGIYPVTADWSSWGPDLEWDEIIALPWSAHERPLSVLSAAQREHQKNIPGWVADHWIREEFDKDTSLFFTMGTNQQIFQTFMKDFLNRLARNFPTIIKERLDKVVDELLTQTVRADKSTEDALGRPAEDPSFEKGKKAPEPPPPEEKRDLKPIDLQCFLMENIAMIADYKGKKHQSNPYKNLMQLKAGSNSPGDTISILTCKGKQQEVGELLNLAPSTYAALVPYIKLYRLDYTNANDADPMVPIRQQEIPIPNYMDPEDVSRITSGQLGRTSGWGIQSFNWKLDGLQPETVDNNISANLKLYFQSVDDLFKGARNGAGQDQAGRDMAGPLDLLIPSAACRKKDDDDDDPPPSLPGPTQSCVDAEEASIAQGRDGACFRIKVVAGWATPPNLEETHPDLKQKVGSETRGEVLRRGLQETRITLYLQQTRHNLTFNENGSCSLSIDYQAALSGILTDNRLDILGTNDTYMQSLLKPWEEKAKAAGKDADKIYRRLERSTPQKDLAKTVRNDEGYKAAKKKQTDYVKKQIELQNEDKLRKYKRFLSRLYGRHEGGASDSPKMYVIEIDPKLVRRKKLADEEDPKVRAKRARQLMTATSAQRGWAITNPLAYEAGKSGENTNLLDLIGGTDDLEEASKATDGVDKQFMNNIGSGKNMYIPFFYLGDLIDTILQNNKTTQFGEGGNGVPGGFMTFMADMDITNPLLLYQANEDEQTDLMCASRSSINSMKLMKQLQAKGYMVSGGVKKRINIGQIPISLDSFNVWFKNRVIKSGRPTYYLLHFLKDICAQLITDALKSDCFNTNIINDIRFDLSHIHFNNRDSKGAHIYPDGPLHTVPVRRLAKLVGSSDTRHRDIPPRNISETEKQRYNITSGLVLFCSDAHPHNRRGRKGISADQDIGIYHNYVGSPVGLVKKIGFSRIAQQYLREAKIQKAGNLGAEQLRELYSANLELIGNTLYRNGQYTFLWPSAMTTGDDSRIINLGLGGYFLIKSVSHTIGPSGYNVSMTALQEGMEIGPQPTVEAGLVEGDISPDTNPNFNTIDEGGRVFLHQSQEEARLAALETERMAAVQALEEAARLEDSNKLKFSGDASTAGGMKTAFGVVTPNAAGDGPFIPEFPGDTPASQTARRSHARAAAPKN
jgi:hypothetical protein